MLDFTKYNPEDFLANESFVNYLLTKDQSDTRFWQNWIKENPACKKTVDEASLLYFVIRDQKETLQNQQRIEIQYDKLQSLIKDAKVTSEGKVISLNSEKVSSPKIRSGKFVWKVASVAAVLLIALSFWMYHGASTDVHSHQADMAFAKTANHSKNILLPDGSRVILNNNSSIDISKDFNKTKREVTLTGSAFFEIYKDHSRPFIVTSGMIKITAVGTAFYIYNLHAESATVSLLEGKVKIEGKQNLIFLLPGEKALLGKDDLIFRETFNKDQLQDFTNGKIKFEHAGIKEIKNVLQEYFNMEIAVNGDIPVLNFTGDFDSGNIQPILDALQFTYNINYKITGRKLTLSF